MKDSIYIERLKERLRNNPDSLVFLSLAEELKKRDMVEEAVKVLEHGVQKRPEFIAARFVLARLYLLMGMYLKAEKESLAIAEINTHDIAQKELAEAYVRNTKKINRLNNFLSLIQKRFS